MKAVQIEGFGSPEVLWASLRLGSSLIRSASPIHAAGSDHRRGSGHLGTPTSIGLEMDKDNLIDREQL